MPEPILGLKPNSIYVDVRGHKVHVDDMGNRASDNSNWRFSKYCKCIVHECIQPEIRGPEMGLIMQELQVDSGYTVKPRWIVRAFRHLHKRAMRKVIGAYFDCYEGKMTKDEAFNVLKTMLEYEYENMLPKCDTWDVKFLKMFASADKNGELIRSMLHAGLLKLKRDVVLLEWCSEWKNQRFEWCYTKGPYYRLIRPNALNQTRLGQDINPESKTLQNVHIINAIDAMMNQLFTLTHDDKHQLIIDAWLHPGWDFPDNHTEPLESSVIIENKKLIEQFKIDWDKRQQEYVGNPWHKHVLYRYGNPFYVVLGRSSRNAMQKKTDPSQHNTHNPNDDDADSNHDDYSCNTDGDDTNPGQQNASYAYSHGAAQTHRANGTLGGGGGGGGGGTNLYAPKQDNRNEQQKKIESKGRHKPFKNLKLPTPVTEVDDPGPAPQCPEGYVPGWKKVKYEHKPIEVKEPGPEPTKPTETINPREKDGWLDEDDASEREVNEQKEQEDAKQWQIWNSWNDRNKKYKTYLERLKTYQQHNKYCDDLQASMRIMDDSDDVKQWKLDYATWKKAHAWYKQSLIWKKNYDMKMKEYNQNEEKKRKHFQQFSDQDPAKNNSGKPKQTKPKDETLASELQNQLNRVINTRAETENKTWNLYGTLNIAVAHDRPKKRLMEFPKPSTVENRIKSWAKQLTKSAEDRAKKEEIQNALDTKHKFCILHDTFHFSKNNTCALCKKLGGKKFWETTFWETRKQRYDKLGDASIKQSLDDNEQIQQHKPHHKHTGQTNQHTGHDKDEEIEVNDKKPLDSRQKSDKLYDTDDKCNKGVKQTLKRMVEHIDYDLLLNWARLWKPEKSDEIVTKHEGDERLIVALVVNIWMEQLLIAFVEKQEYLWKCWDGTPNDFWPEENPPFVKEKQQEYKKKMIADLEKSKTSDTTWDREEEQAVSESEANIEQKFKYTLSMMMECLSYVVLCEWVQYHKPMEYDLAKKQKDKTQRTESIVQIAVDIWWTILEPQMVNKVNEMKEFVANFWDGTDLSARPIKKNNFADKEIKIYQSLMEEDLDDKKHNSALQPDSNPFLVYM